MAYQPDPDDRLRTGLTDSDVRRDARINRTDGELQRNPHPQDPDPEVVDSSVSGARIAMFAVAIAVVLGAVFYGLNNATINKAGTTPTAQTAQTQPANPVAPPGMRDVTPKPNDEPGMTTGAAPARPAPPSSQPTGAEVNRSAASPDNSAPASK